MKSLFCTIHPILFFTISTVSHCCSIPEQLELLKSPLNEVNKEKIRKRLETIQALLELTYRSDKKIDLGNLESHAKRLQKAAVPLSGGLESRCGEVVYQIHEEINEIATPPTKQAKIK